VGQRQSFFLRRQADLCSGGTGTGDPFGLTPLARFDLHAGVQLETSHAVRNEWLYFTRQALKVKTSRAWRIKEARRRTPRYPEPFL